MSNILQDIMGMLTRKKEVAPKLDDYFVIGRYASPKEKLKPHPNVDSELVLMKDLASFINTYIINNSVNKIVPYFLLAEPDGNTDFDIRYNMVDIDWDGGSGTHVLNLPSAVAHPYRIIRISNNATVTASNQIHVTPPVGETIDGVAFYSINKAFNGIAVWSDGVRWIVIQAKAT